MSSLKSINSSGEKMLKINSLVFFWHLWAEKKKTTTNEHKRNLISNEYFEENANVRF